MAGTMRDNIRLLEYSKAMVKWFIPMVLLIKSFGINTTVAEDDLDNWFQNTHFSKKNKTNNCLTY